MSLIWKGSSIRLRAITTATGCIPPWKGRHPIKFLMTRYLFRLDSISSPGCHTVVGCFIRRWRCDWEFAMHTRGAARYHGLPGRNWGNKRGKAPLSPFRRRKGIRFRLTGGGASLYRTPLWGKFPATGKNTGNNGIVNVRGRIRSSVNARCIRLFAHVPNETRRREQGINREKQFARDTYGLHIQVARIGS